MIAWIYRFVRGFLKISVSGKNTSRFLNLCAKYHIVMWRLESTDSVRCDCYIYLKDFYRLKRLVKKTRVQVRIRKKIGMPFLLHRYRSRKVFPAVILLMILGVVLLSGRIWRIEVVGNSSIDCETVLDYLETKDVTYGTTRNSIDNDELELSIRKDFEPVIWASVYEEGTKLVVCIQEKIISEKEETDAKTCMDLCAKRDAVIASVITRSGLAAVKAGDVVKEGDLLVSARQEILDDNGEVKEYYYRSADADIMGYTSYDYEDWISDTRMIETDTGNERTRFFLRIHHYQFTSPKLYADYDYSKTIEDTRQLCLLDSFYLPVYYGTIREIEKEQTVSEVSMEEAKKLALEHLEQFLSDLEENGVRILDKNVMIERKDEKYHIYGRVDACESITKQVPTEILTTPSAGEEEQEE